MHPDVVATPLPELPLRPPAHRVHPRAVTWWRIRAAAGLLVFAVPALALLFVIGAMSTAILTAGEEHEGEAAAATSAELDLTADPSGVAAYDKKSGTVTAGTVTVKLTNESPLEHNVAVAQGARELGRSDTIKGSETELKVDLKPGKYEFYCTVDGHRAAGMEGTLTVR